MDLESACHRAQQPERRRISVEQLNRPSRSSQMRVLCPLMQRRKPISHSPLLTQLRAMSQPPQPAPPADSAYLMQLPEPTPVPAARKANDKGSGKQRDCTTDCTALTGR